MVILSFTGGIALGFALGCAASFPARRFWRREAERLKAELFVWQSRD